MKATILRARSTTTDGRSMTLHEHDGAFTIRIAGVELMSTRQHDSEERLAALGCGHIDRATPQPRVLIGGLGLGFTLRAALGVLPMTAAVIVVELLPAVIDWNREPAYGLGGDALLDPRVEVIAGDVSDIIGRSRQAFDSIILDIDNGPSGLCADTNGRLYTTAGLKRARAALRPGGCLAIWSAGEDRGFEARLGRCGFRVKVERARTHPGGGSWNTLFVGRA